MRVTWSKELAEMEGGMEFKWGVGSGEAEYERGSVWLRM
jgi:hypothetical protein